MIKFANNNRYSVSVVIKGKYRQLVPGEIVSVKEDDVDSNLEYIFEKGLLTLLEGSVKHKVIEKEIIEEVEEVIEEVIEEVEEVIEEKVEEIVDNEEEDKYDLEKIVNLSVSKIKLAMEDIDSVPVLELLEKLEKDKGIICRKTALKAIVDRIDYLMEN